MIPPNTSSDTNESADAAEPSANAGLTALVVRLAGEFSVDAATLSQVAAVFEATRQSAPDIFVPTTAALAAAFAGLAGPADADAAPLYAALHQDFAEHSAAAPLLGERVLELCAAEALRRLQ